VRVAQTAPERLVVVGASVAGLAACEALRDAGWDGEIALVGAEHHAPYDRPPLSKQLLLGTMDAHDLELRGPDELDALELDMRLGRTATALNVAARSVKIDDGTTLAGRGVILATGSRPLRLPGQPLEPPFFELRTLDDALAVRAALDRAERVVIIGAGFIGLEAAAAARAAGCEVIVLEAAERPMGRLFARELAEPLVALHASRGIDLRCGARVGRLTASASGSARVEIADAPALEADAVLVGVGAVPAVDWLGCSGLDVRGGVRCDAALGAAPGVWAIGDIARWEHPLFGQIRVEHWTTAREHAQVAARNVLWSLRRQGARAVAGAVPYFWSDQHGVKIQMAGWPAGARQVEEVTEEGRRLFRLGRGGRLVAALSWDWPRRLAHERRAIANRARFDAPVSIGRDV
jgi:NADPH-dependent 2,4-dienoyl-CoA reductase/sulfur reductase-like enzyme